MPDLLVYEIKPGETPETVASKHGMTAAELLDFHNRHCSDFGLLWMNAFIGVQKIIVPASYKAKEDFIRQKEEFLPPKSFSPKHFAPKYTVSEGFKNQEEDSMEITYNLSLDFSKKEIDGIKTDTVSQNRENFKKNNAEPDDKMSGLALDCMNAVSPIEFEISEVGKLARLYDFKNLAKKFSEKKADIRDFHIGEVAENYIAKFEENIADEDYLFSQLGTTLLNQTLFPGNSVYHQDGKFERKLKIIPNSFPVKILFENQYDFEDEDFAVVYMYGDIIEACSLQELLRGRRFGSEPEDFVTGTINISYNIRKQNRRIEKVSAEIVLFLDEEVYYQYNLKISNDGQ